MTEFPAPVVDPELASASGLFGEQASLALSRFLEDRRWRLDDARPVQALYRPGRSLVVRYKASACDPDGNCKVVTLCAETRAGSHSDVAPPADLGPRYGLPDPVSRVGPYLVWAYPYDPSLGALPDAAWGPAVREKLANDGRRPFGVTVRLMRYRPRRRAVFHYAAHYRGGVREASYAKVLRASQARRALSAAQAVGGSRRGLRRRRRPRLLLPASAPSDGMLLFPPATGRSLRDLLVEGAAVPSPERLVRLTDELGAFDLPDAGSDIARKAAFLGELVSAVVPEKRDAAQRVIEAACEDGLPRRVVHGDLYDAQVFVDPDFSLGLIDLDDMGPGDPAMDAANVCAHLLALGLSVPAAASRLVAYRELVREAFMRRLEVSPRAFGWREGLAMLALATGPFRVLRPDWPRQVGARVDLALRLAFPCARGASGGSDRSAEVLSIHTNARRTGAKRADPPS